MNFVVSQVPARFWLSSSVVMHCYACLHCWPRGLVFSRPAIWFSTKHHAVNHCSCFTHYDLRLAQRTYLNRRISWHARCVQLIGTDAVWCWIWCEKSSVWTELCSLTNFVNLGAVQVWSHEPDNAGCRCPEARGCRQRRHWTLSSSAEVRTSVKLLPPYYAACRLMRQYATLSCCYSAL